MRQLNNYPWIARLEKAGVVLENALLATILSSMILLAGSQIVLRNLFNTSIIWGDGLLRILVLWIAAAGGLAASRSEKHLSIAILDQLLSPAWKLRTGLLTNLFTAFVCGVLCWFSVEFVLSTKEFGDQVLNHLPAWYFQLALPLGFGLIAWRYLLHAVNKLLSLTSKSTEI